MKFILFHSNSPRKLDTLFNSLKEAAMKYNVYRSSISACCRNKMKYSGEHPNTGEKLKWMYHD